MMNVFAVWVIVSSVAAAGLWQNRDGTKVIVREGHRVVVVEYDDNTKVSISDAAKVRTSDSDSPVCDAYGKCKHKIVNAFKDAKEAVKDRAHDAKEALKEKAHDAKEAVVDKAKDRAIDRASGEGGYGVGNAAGKGRDKVYEQAHDVVFRGQSVKRGLGHVMSIMGLLGFTTALGTSIWVTFVSSYVLARAMGRNHYQFGVVQSKVYPVYFKLMALCIGTALVGHLMTLSNPAQAWNLSASLLILLANLFLIEPRATKVMLERMKTQKEEGRGIGEAETTSITRVVQSGPVANSATTRVSVPTALQDDRLRARVDELNRKLKRYNSCSSVLNLLTLAGLIWHLVYLNQLIQSCVP